MFEVGFTEIVLILGLALLVLGPEKLPGLVEKVGRWTGRARAMARQLRTQLEHEVTLEELARSKTMHPPSSSSSTTSTPASEPVPPRTDVDGVPHESPATPAATTVQAPEEPQWGDSEDSSSEPSTTKASQ
jgi:sec-independent protein translocase protein TatB